LFKYSNSELAGRDCGSGLLLLLLLVLLFWYRGVGDIDIGIADCASLGLFGVARTAVSLLF
jgi:hypothetical protein